MVSVVDFGSCVVTARTRVASTVNALQIKEYFVPMSLHHGGEGRTRLRQLVYRGRDWAVLAFFLIFTAAVGVLGHFGF